MPWRMRVTFMALAGVQGPLPRAYVERMLGPRARTGAIRAFLDMFHHRLVSIFYRARKSRRIAMERDCCDPEEAFIGALMVVLVPPAGNEYFNRLAQAKTYDARLRLIPRDAVVIAGAQTVAVQYWRGIGLGEWDWIGVGAGWPAGQLESKIDEHLKAGRREEGLQTLERLLQRNPTSPLGLEMLRQVRGGG